MKTAITFILGVSVGWVWGFIGSYKRKEALLLRTSVENQRRSGSLK